MIHLNRIYFTNTCKGSMKTFLFLYSLFYYLCIMNWKEIKQAPLYEVSNTGLIRRKETGRILKSRDGRSKHQLVNLHYGKGVQKTFPVHRLVAIAFIPNTKNYEVVDHIDRNPRNNNVENLRWSTQADNVMNSKSPKSIRIKYIPHHKHWSVDVLGKCWYHKNLDDAVNCLKEQTATLFI